MNSLVGLLTPSQLLYTDEISQVLVYETDAVDKILSSDDGQGEVLENAKHKAIKEMVRSISHTHHKSERDATNQRLIDMVRIHYAHRDGIRIGFNRFN